MSAGVVFFGLLAGGLTDWALTRLNVDRATTLLIVLAIAAWFAWFYYTMRHGR